MERQECRSTSAPDKPFRAVLMSNKRFVVVVPSVKRGLELRKLCTNLRYSRIGWGWAPGKCRKTFDTFDRKTGRVFEGTIC